LHDESNELASLHVGEGASKLKTISIILKLSGAIE
jgi:hypothetical protein